MADAVRAPAVLMRPEELLVHLLPDGKAELVRGELRVMSPAGGPRGRVATNLVILLSKYLDGRGLGWVYADGAELFEGIAT